MRVILISSPGLRQLEIYQSIGVRAPPLGLAYIASVLEEAGHKVSIIDASTLGLSVEETAKMALSNKPDIIGISAVTPTAKGAYSLAKIIKEKDPTLKIVMGGPHVSFLYTEALTNGADYVVMGEGERTTLELIEFIESFGDSIEPVNVKGLAYRDKDGQVKLTAPRPLIRDLDSLPEPARHLLPMDKYTLFDKPIKIIHVMASRGCPYGCIYCSTSYFWGRRYRIRSPSKVAEEVERSTEKYRTNIIVFSDDELTLLPQWVDSFVNEIKSRGLDITFTCGSRVSSVSKEMLIKLKRAGCTTIYYGIESYKDEDIEKIGKRITISQAIKAVSWSKEAGIETAGSFILGFPWQTVEDMEKTIGFSIKLGVDYAQYTVATPYPGTPLYRMAKENGLIEIYDWDYYTTVYPVMRGYSFTREEAGKMLKKAYRRFYLRPTFIISQARKGRLRTLLDIVARALKSYISRNSEETGTNTPKPKERKGQEFDVALLQKAR